MIKLTEIRVQKIKISIEKCYFFNKYNSQNEYSCLININEQKIEKKFATEKQRDEYYEILKAYIEGRKGRRESEINEGIHELVPLIQKLNEDILSIENSYCEDIKKKIEDRYKKYKMQG